MEGESKKDLFTEDHGNLVYQTGKDYINCSYHVVAKDGKPNHRIHDIAFRQKF